ncbi:MAG: hypothetical protein K8I60_05395, partial [Anaerolineae bacterium]|nr:hypothetical protein [Anaerolineae bacterium]
VDDSPEAETFTADLPTTGSIPAAATNAQTPFSHNFPGPADISLIVGGKSGGGQFIVIIEGLAVTPDDGKGDGAGDHFSVRLTPNVMTSNVPITAYMISVTSALDSLVQLVDANNNLAMDRSTGKSLPVECDDAGDVTSCWGGAASLEGASVSRTYGRSLFGGAKDAALTVPLVAAMSQNADPADARANFLMTSFRQVTLGDYVAIFHLGVDGENASTTAPPTQLPATPPPPQHAGISVTCPDGAVISNGVEVLVNMRAGFNYTATVVGKDGFDPIVAVRYADEVRQCVDDSPEASRYTANLPTTGAVPNSNVNSQVEFSLAPATDEVGDISLVIGGFHGSPGEFVVILEGLAVTREDTADGNQGDPFAVVVTPNLVQSGIPATAYMISITGDLDSMILLADVNRDVPLNPNGDTIECDNAGTASCWGNSSDLSGSSVSRTRDRLLNAHSSDAMLSIPLDAYAGLAADNTEYLLEFFMTSRRQTLGDYVVVFHLGIGAPPAGG